MSDEKTKFFTLLQHPLSEYIRVTAFLVVALLTIFILRLFGSRDNSENKIFQSGNKLVKTVRIDT